jgi:hypothetical protein
VCSAMPACRTGGFEIRGRTRFPALIPRSDKADSEGDSRIG